MRDIAITLIIFGSLPFILRRAQYGVIMWVWVSVMNPHRLTYGFAHDFNFAAIIAGVTLLSALLSKDLKRPPMNAITVPMLLFAAWTGVTTIFALLPDASFIRWTEFMKTMLMTMLIPMLIHKKEDLQLLIWVLVLSIAYYGTKGGVFTLMTGGTYRVWGPESSYVQENNALAVALIMMIPLMRYLQLTSERRNVRLGLVAAMLLCAVSVIGSQSRGALLGATAMLGALWWKGRNKLSLLLVLIVLVPSLLAFAPETWFKRMDTMNTYEQERSAAARLTAWATMINIANDRPLVGGGFRVDQPFIYQRYSRDPLAYAHVAHSIYFQALGEHGYVGLGLYLLIFVGTWRTASAIIRKTRGRTDLVWARDLSTMMQATLIGFAVGGAFLSLVLFDVPYYLAVVMVITRTLVERELKTQSSAPASVPGPLTARVGPNRSPRPGSG